MFELNWQASCKRRAVLQPGVWRLELPEAGHSVSAAVDGVLRGRAQTLSCSAGADAGQHVLLPQHGGLISNLRLWENIMLPRWYHGGPLGDADEQRLLDWVARLLPDQAEPARWLHQTVGQTHMEDRALAGLLRVLAAAAPWIWLEADWLLSMDADRVRPCLDLLASEVVASGRVVLVHAPDAQATQAMAAWNTVALTLEWMDA